MSIVPRETKRTRRPWGLSNQVERLFSTEEDIELSLEFLDLITKPFTKPLAKDIWKELSASCSPIKGTERFMRAPTMDFDDGLDEQQGPFLTVARPILAVLMNLDSL